MVENFLGWFTEADVLANKDQEFDLLNDYNCARAIVGSYFRERWIRLLDNHAVPVPMALIPKSEAAAATNTYRLWVTKEQVSEIYTESNAAWDLYQQCNHGKISVADARALVFSKSGQHPFDWKKVLLYFSKHGGRHTDKYLRRT